MSKLALKKELEHLSSTQLIQIILDLYDARKEAKEYLEFFLNPDIYKAMDSRLEIVKKEMRRTKWGRSRGRVTIIKKAVADILSLKPGPLPSMRMLLSTISTIGITARFYELTDAQEKLAGDLAGQIIEIADENEMMSDALAMLHGITEDDQQYTRRFRTIVTEGLEKKVASISRLKK